MVAATASPNTASAAKLKNAAQITAQCGRSTRVDTTVAMEFAASWKPFMKSNASATAIRNTTTSKPIATSGALEDDALDDVRHVLAAVRDGLEVLVDLLQLDQLARVRLVPEELRQRRAQHLVGVGLEAVDLAAELHDGFGVPHVVEQLHRRLDLLGAGDADLGQTLGLLRDLADVVEEHALRHVFHQIEDVVHARDQEVDLVAVDRRYESLVQQLDRLVG